MPTAQQQSRINDVLYYIHQDISNELPALKLAAIAAYSEQHFHRVFKAVVGESVHQYIRRIRLEFAANQLMFDDQSSVLDIATKAGFSSLSSFSRAFKSVFSLAPGQWRVCDHPPHNIVELALNSDNNVIDHDIAEAYRRINTVKIPSYELLELPPRHVAYIRHQGYGRSITNVWKTLQVWASTQQRDFSQQFGLHHSNPAWIELSKCRYVACIAIDKPLQQRGIINSMTIPGGLHAVFSLQGKYGELLPQLQQILTQWLPSSGFKLLSTPAYVHYHNNQFLSKDQQFTLDYCLPIALFS